MGLEGLGEAISSLFKIAVGLAIAVVGLVIVVIYLLVTR